MDKDHFLTLVAKDVVVRTHGVPTKEWPPANLWAMISTVKCSIKEEQIPQLMHSYNVEQLTVNQPGVILNDTNTTIVQV